MFLKNNSKLKKLGKNINNFLSFADGTNSIEDISTLINLDLKKTKQINNLLKKKKLFIKV